MCGRYIQKGSAEKVAEWFDIEPEDLLVVAPSYNVAPQTSQPVVRLDRETDHRELVLMRWGFIPYWSKNAKIGYSTINAKSETVTTSPIFREAFRRRRCLVPASGFYEWQKISAKTKQPYAIALKTRPNFAFAGLWDRWTDKATGQPLETYTILTTDPNELTASVHDRMPVILAPKDYARWLAPADPAQLPVDLLRPYSADEMEIWKVRPEVGNVRNDSPELAAPMTESQLGLSLTPQP